MFNITNDYTPEEESAILEGRADIWGLDEGASKTAGEELDQDTQLQQITKG